MRKGFAAAFMCGLMVIGVSACRSHKTVENEPVPEEKAVTVDFSAAGGFYEDAFDLALSSEPGFTVYYTTDGSDPKTNGTAYTAPIAVSPSKSKAGPLTKSIAASFQYAAPASQIVGTVVKAYAKSADACTDVVANTYIVSEGFCGKYGLPCVSLSLEPGDFATKSGIYVSVMDHPYDAKERKVAYCEVFDRSGSRVAGQYVELAMNGNGSLVNLQKSMRLYFKKAANPEVADNPGKLDFDVFEGRVKGSAGKTITAFDRLILRDSGNDCNSSMLRDALMQRLCKGMNVDMMEAQPSLVFINGEFWGLYNLRERYDPKYFNAHYGIAEENIVMLEAPTPHLTGNGNSPYELNDGEPGDEQPFYDLIQYAKSHNLSKQEYFDHVAAQIDCDNFIDFYIANLFFCNIDWPTNNIKVWRNKNPEDPSGFDTRWRFVLLDMDMGCGYAGQVSENMMTRINCNTIASDLMNALMKNSEFRAKFIDRFLFLLENQFSAEKTVPVLEAMAAEIDQAERLNIQRWPAAGLTVSGWKNQIGVIRSFLQNRAAYAKEDLSQYFHIVQKSVSFVFSDEAASLQVNNAGIAAGTTVSFDAGMQFHVQALVKDGYEFVGIAVTDQNGKQTVYREAELNFTPSEKATVTVLARKRNFKTREALVAGSRDIFYLKENGDLYAWGASEYGQCGIFTGDSLLPVSLVASSVRKVVTSQGGNVGDAPHTLLLTADNRLYAVGNNQFAQTGNVEEGYFTLKPVGGVPDGIVADISAGYDHTLILMENGDLYGIGNNAYGQLGAKNLGGAVYVFTKIASGVSAMAAGRRHSLYITDGKLFALGDNRWHKLTAASAEKFTAPVLIASDARSVFAGEHSSFYIDQKGGLFYFGWRSVTTFAAGEGDGKLHKIMAGVAAVSMQDEHAIIITLDGKIYGWGMNSEQQIPSGTNAAQSTPVEIAASGRSGAAGSWFSAILNADGSVAVFGKNASGITGTGSASGKTEAVTIPASKFELQ